ncbi:MAG: rRNA maturation RNase YbeY [Verrucomicrobiota bacterium]
MRTSAACELTIRNRQRTRRVDLRLFRRTANSVLQDLLKLNQYNLGLYLVTAREMTHLNETFLHHEGSTDVITFNYAEPGEPEPASSRGHSIAAAPARLHGEIIICIDEAVIQAHRFHTSWQSELTRYLVHGLLHLRGYDDHHAAARRRMKREEDRLLRHLADRFDLIQLGSREQPSRD